MTMEKMAAKIFAKYKNGAYRGEIDGYDYQLTETSAGFGFKQYYITFILDKPTYPLQMKAIRHDIGFFGLLFTSVILELNTVSICVGRLKKTMERLHTLVKFFQSRDMKTLTREIYGSDAEVTSYKTVCIKTIQGIKHEVTIPVNDEIYNRAYQKQVEVLKKEDQSNKFIIGGLLSAVLGAIIGSIPSVLAYEYGFMSGWLYILVPFVSFYFYKFAKGKQHKFVPLIIGLISIAVNVMLFIYTWVSIAGSYNYELVDFLVVEDFRNAFREDLFFLFLGNILGVALSYRFIYSRTTAGKLKDLEALK